jgi:Tfp pilus assembly protein PilO
MIKALQIFSGFLSRLSRREKMVFYAASIAIGLTVLDRALVAPISSRIRLLNQEIEAKETAIKNGMRIIAQKDRISAESQKYKPYMAQAKSQDEENTILLKEIENLASKSAVYLLDMKPGPVKNIAASVKFTVTVSCEGQMEQIAEFMYGIETSRNLLTIDKFQVNPKTRESTIGQCSLTVSKIAM